MPDMGTGTGGESALIVLAELAVFWTAAVVHLIRMLAVVQLPDPDRGVDAGHAAMGAGIVVMVFPGVPASAEHALAGLFAVLAVPFGLHALRLRPGAQRGQHAAIAAGQLAMAFILAAPANQPQALTMVVAGVLAGCAVVHARRLLDARHWLDQGASKGTRRMLVTVPHVAALVMTLAMAGMAVTS